MSKINSQSSNNSVTSSEASDTQSVEDIINSDAFLRVNKEAKKMKEPTVDKDAEAKRPPWRAVSVSTLPKPDKNSLLKAKLLDASRRLRAGKISVGVQTDVVSTKLMREASLGAQTDLILYKDVGILTDGSYTKRKEGSDEYILTYSVPQMTDTIIVDTVGTQTLLPKISHEDFMEAYYNLKPTEIYDVNKFTKSEQNLLTQIQKIRETIKLRKLESDHLDPTTNVFDNVESSDNEHSNNENQSKEEYIRKCNKRNFLKPTFASWHFEYDGIDGNFQPYVVTRYDTRTNGNLVPVSSNRRYIDNHGLYWNTLLLSIDELIEQSNRLVNVTKNLLLKRNNQSRSIGNKVIPKFEQFIPKKPDLPSDYWLPIIEQQEKELQEMYKMISTV